MNPQLKPSHSTASRWPRNISLNHGQAARLSYRSAILNADGSIARPWSDWRHNLILDQGLNQLGNGTANGWPNGFEQCAVGTGALVISRSATALGITFTQVGNQVTASAPFFSASDVGRLLKYGVGTAGAEKYITGFTSNLIVTVSDAVGAGPIGGVVWYVNVVGLVAETSRTNAKSTLAGENGSTFVAATGVVTHKRTFLFAAVGAPITYHEIGFAYTGTVGNNLFDADSISPGDSLTTGQQYKVQVQLTVTYSPTAPAAVGNVGTGCNTAGNVMIETLTAISAATYEFINSSTGASSSPGPFDPATPGACQIATAAYVQNAVPGSAAGYQGVPVATLSLALVLNAYAAGSFTRTASCTYPVNTLNANMYGIGFSAGPTLNTLMIDVLFTNPQAVVNADTIAVTFSKSWNHVLTN